jgi:hypothetical protein
MVTTWLQALKSRAWESTPRARELGHEIGGNGFDKLAEDRCLAAARTGLAF